MLADTTIFESSSGNCACSEAYLAQRLGLNFTAVVSHSHHHPLWLLKVPSDLEPAKLARIERYGARILRGPHKESLLTVVCHLYESRIVRITDGGKGSGEKQWPFYESVGECRSRTRFP